MKKAMKKLMAALLAVAMLCAMAVPAFAAGSNTSITINGTGKTYAAYRLLNATNDGDKYSYTFNDKYEAIVKTATGADNLADVVSTISSYTAADLDAFALKVWKAIKADATLTADATTDNKIFTDVPQGYYLIVETATEDEGDTYSLLMLNTAGKNAVTVTAKEDSPELEKKVKEKNDSTGYTSSWQDGADYDVGDHVPFLLTGTVSAKYNSYSTYRYVFHDKMSDGLTFDKDSVVVKVDDTVVTGGYTVETDSISDDCTFEVVFDDLKQITGATVTPTSKITVEYTAELNGDSVIGSNGNPNEARLEFANNPYGGGTGYTPWDKVIVFTYKLVANKVDATGAALAGAGFTLYKYDNTTNDWNAVGSEITGVTTFTFNRVDAGQYKLVETTVPEGYNKAEDLIFFVKAEYDTTSSDPKLTALKVVDADGNELLSGETKVFNTNLAEGSLTTDVINRSGTVLPGTGGIGTTIFYVVGGGLMVAAAVLLITKKRMEGKN